MRFYQTAAITNAILAVAVGEDRPVACFVYAALACLCLLGLSNREKKAEQCERERTEQWLRD